jgi:excisionase family DNA binding protein
MNNSSELQRLADSIANLVSTITEIINAKAQAATAHATQAEAQVPARSVPATARTPCADPIMNKRQLAGHLQVSVRTIDNLMERGYLPHYKIGKIVRFKLSDVHDNLDARHKRHAYRSRQ